ncbi:nuclear factor 7, brain-like [Leptodactylus fuscus]|uniref:nuclear factor 7, brain-like n=1 Tax=Leptodactylus fuscus TaxID=238119 RepID=UPI003F4E717C
MACAGLIDELPSSVFETIRKEPETLFRIVLEKVEGPDCPPSSSSAGACADLGDELTCSICLSIYKDPVTLRCGHNFCQECILSALEGSGPYNCPECRLELQERPTLRRNVALTNIAERFQCAQSPPLGPDGVCTYCIHSPTAAVKSCLHCEASLCESHVRVHNKSEEHVLADPTAFLESKRCPIHKKILQYYCPKDAACICLLCRLDGDHIGHHVEPLTEATEKKKEKVENVLKKLTQNKKITEERLQSLKEQRQESKTLYSMAATDLFQSLRRTMDQLEKMILDQTLRQSGVMSIISDLIRKMEIKKDEMSNKIGHLEALRHMTDPWSVLQDPQSSREDFFAVEEAAILVPSGVVQAAAVLDKLQLSEMLRKWLTVMMSHAKMIYNPEETTLSLDPQRAGISVEISEDLKVASWSQIRQGPWGAQHHLHRYQVWSYQRFSSGKHYWDVETSKSGTWDLGVCYTSMPRTEYIGASTTSWCLSKVHARDQYAVVHNDEAIDIYPTAPCYRFRLHLDYEAGQLSFYELSDPIRLLHTVTATFQEPLHAVFYVCNAWLRIRS